jgi:hypothetical protein
MAIEIARSRGLGGVAATMSHPPIKPFSTLPEKRFYTATRRFDARDGNFTLFLQESRPQHRSAGWVPENG